MSRKIYITETQLRNLMRSKINENVGEEVTFNIEDMYKKVIYLVKESKFTVVESDWNYDKNYDIGRTNTLTVIYSFDMDNEEEYHLEVKITGDLCDYSYEYEDDRFYLSNGDPGYPGYFDDEFKFKYEPIKPDDIKIIRTYDYEYFSIDDKTYEAIKDIVYDEAVDTFEEEYDYDEFRANYDDCYSDDDPCRDDY